MSVEPSWKEERLVESFDVDCRGLLRPQTLFGYLLNAAWIHAKATRYSYEELTARNAMWVLIKAHLLIRGLPSWGDRMRIETWGKRVERLYALRDFSVTSSAGEKLVSATSSWVVLDRATGRPQRFAAEADGFPWQPQREELPTNLEKVPAPADGRPRARFRVLFSDIDVNRHVNSTRYLQWMLDSCSDKRLEEEVPTSIELSFLSEALSGDDVEVVAEERAEGELLSVRRATDGKELCRGRIEWRRVATGGR